MDNLRMYGDYITMSVEEVAKKIKDKFEDYDDFSESVVQSGKVILLSIAKYYMRSGTYVPVSILISDEGSHISILISSVGGGKGLDNSTWGAREKSIKQVKKFLEEMGFKAVEEE